MSQFPNVDRGYELDYQSRVGSSTVIQFFNAVYAWMAAGLGVTAVVAWSVSTQPQLMQSIFRGPLLFVLILAELGLVVAISGMIQRINTGVATALFLLYSALNGLTLSAIFIVYAHATIASAFVVTAGTFAAMSVYGFVTKTDLTKFGPILFMALIGLIIASVVNIFMASSGLYWIITYAGVLIFVGLTAYDTQKLKIIAVQTESNPALAARLSIAGALSLYLDFINLFLFILRIMGNRR
jgi:FtsH-binding integral membrane protein